MGIYLEEENALQGGIWKGKLLCGGNNIEGTYALEQKTFKGEIMLKKKIIVEGGTF